MRDDADAAYLNQEYDARSATRSFDKDAIYRQRSHEAFRQVDRIADVVYDASSNSKLDIYPAGIGSPLFVWIHGGYWRASTKDENAFVVPGLVAKGITVASVDYTLAPAVSIGEIVRQVRASIAWLAHNAGRYGYEPRRIHVGGHSAGGHLVGMLLADQWQAGFGLPGDVIGTGLAISGLFDLTPLRKTFVNDALRLDDASIRENSPMNFIPKKSTSRLLATVGGNESSQFKKQTKDYYQAWMAAGNAGAEINMPGFHHFDIILQLETPGNPLFDSLMASISSFE